MANLTILSNGDRRSLRFAKGVVVQGSPVIILDRDGTGATGHGRPNGIVPASVSIARVWYGSGASAGELRLEQHDGSADEVMLAWADSGFIDFTSAGGMAFTTSTTSDGGDIQLNSTVASTGVFGHVLVELIFHD